MREPQVQVYRIEPDCYDELPDHEKPGFCLYVVNGMSEYGWSVRIGATNANFVMNRHGQHRYDSRRYIRHWRFPLEEALAIAQKHVNGTLRNRWTAQQFVDWLKEHPE